MVIIPFVKLKYKTDLSVDETIEILDNNIEPKKFSPFGGLGYTELFRGDLLEDNFKIIRNTHFRNPFIPIIQGKIYKENGKTVIKIFLRMHFIVMIFLVYWFVAFIMPVYNNIYNILVNEFGSLNIIVGNIIVILLVYIIMILFFNYDKVKIENIIKDLLEAELTKK